MADNSKLVSLLLQVKNEMSPGVDEASDSLTELEQNAIALEKELARLEAAGRATAGLDQARDSAAAARKAFVDAKDAVAAIHAEMKSVQSSELAASLEEAKLQAAAAKQEFVAASKQVGAMEKTVRDAGVQMRDTAAAEAILSERVADLGARAQEHRAKLEAYRQEHETLASAATESAATLASASSSYTKSTQAMLSGLQAAGADVAQLEQDVSALGAALGDAGRQQAMISSLQSLQAVAVTSKTALEQAQQQVADLQAAFLSAERPTAEQALALEQAEAAAMQMAASCRQTESVIGRLTTELQKSGIETEDLASAQLSLRDTAVRLNSEQQSLNQRLQAEASLLRQSAAEADDAGEQHQKLGRDVRSVADELATARNALLGFLGVDIGIQMLGDVSALVDGYTNMTSRLKLAVGETGNFDAALASVRDTANSAGSSIESVGDLYANLTRATKELNLSQSEVAQLTDTISKSFIVSGASAHEADGAITQLGQALQSGVLRGDEFNSVMEQSPRLARAMAESLGVTTGELRKMAEEGQLTAETVVRAMQQQADAINAEFDQMPTTIAQATQRLTNEWQIFLGELNNTTGASELAVSAINAVAENLDAIAKFAETAGIAVVAAFLAQGVPAVTEFITTLEEANEAGDDLVDTLSEIVLSTDDVSEAFTGLKDAAKQMALTALIGFVIQQTINLVSAVTQLNAATDALTQTNADLAESQKDLAARFVEISEQTGVTVTNMRELEQAIDDGRIVIDEATGSYLSAADAQKLLEERTAQAKQESVDAATQMAYSQEQLSDAYQAVNKNLQTAIDDNSRLASVMSGEVKTALKGGEAGVASLAVALRNTEQQGGLTADQINNGLGAALQGLSDEERTRFGELLKATMAKVAAGADDAGVTVEQLQNLLDSLNASELDAALARLGVSQAELNNQISKGTEQAIKDLGLYQEQLKQSGIDADTAGRLTETAFINAYQNAKSAADKAALDEVLARWAEQGLITAAAMKKIQAETSGLGAATDDLAQRMTDAGIVTQAALDDIAESARKLYDDIVKAGLPIAEQQQAFMNYAEAAIAANSDISESELRLQASRLGMTEQLDELIDKQKQAGDAGKDAGDKAADGAQKAQAATQEVADALGSTAASARSATDDIAVTASRLGNYFSVLRSQVAELSAAAAAEFDRKLGIDSSGAAGELTDLQQAADDAKAALGSLYLDAARGYDATGFTQYVNTIRTANAEVVIAYSQQKTAVDSYVERLQSGNNITESFIATARRALTTSNLLGAENLSTLRSALASATAQLQQMSDSATDTLTSLRQELYSLRGETEALQESQYRQRKAELEAALAEAQAAGNKEAIAAYKEALSTLADIRKEQKAQAKEAQEKEAQEKEAQEKEAQEKEAQASADAATASTAAARSSSSASAKATSIETVTITLGSRSVDVLASDKEDLLAMIEEAANRSR